MTRKLAIVSVLLAACGTVEVHAQQDLLNELYGLGVHAYYAGKYRDAYENLSAAIEGGSRDPRVYYFRGLAQTHLGRSEDAKIDFRKGAELEVAGGGDRYPIGKALERVQGRQRLEIEGIRKIAKIEYQQQQLAENQRRLEQRQNVVEPTIDQQPPPEEAASEAAKIADPTAIVETDPFGDEGGLGVGEATPAPERPDPTATAGGDAFDAGAGDTPDAGGAPAAGSPPATGAGDDPFGAPDAGGAPAAGAGDDPFGAADAGGGPGELAGGAQPAGDSTMRGVIRGIGEMLTPEDGEDNRDPFDDSDEPKAAPPAAGGGVDPFGAPDAGPPANGGAAPAGPPADAAGGDPFGAAEAPAIPSEEPPATAPAEDPFGAPAAGGDPFGAPAGASAPKAEDMKNDPFADDPADDAPAGDPFGG